MVINPFSVANHSPVSREFWEREPDVVEFVPPVQTNSLHATRPMHRLSFGVMTAKEDMSVRELFHMLLAGQLRSNYIFPDTGFITTPIQDEFWEIGPDRLFTFPDIIIGELTGWLTNPLHNKAVHGWLPLALDKCRSDDAIRNGPLRISTVSGLIKNRLQQFSVAVQPRKAISECGIAYDHYVNFLSMRKRVGLTVAHSLESELGRKPNDAEFRNRMRKEFGDDRLSPIALKGWKDWGKVNYLADEELVVSAVITSIMTGEPTTILTRDTDVFDQFAKLCEVITKDYMCYTFGEALYANRVEEMQTLPVDENNSNGFAGNSIQCIILDRHDADSLLPKNSTPVHCFCVLVGNHFKNPKISISGYCFEREMESFLFVKESGKNSSRFPGKNVVAGTDMKNNLNPMFAVIEEKMIDCEGVQTSMIDHLQLLRANGRPMIRKIML